jgi:WD40 repeat protein
VLLASFPIDKKGDDIQQREKSVRFVDESNILVAARSAAPVLYTIKESHGHMELDLDHRLNMDAGYILGNGSEIAKSSVVGFTSKDDGRAVLYNLKENKAVVQLDAKKFVWDIVAPSSGNWIATAYSGDGPDKVAVWSPTGTLVQSLAAGAASTLTLNPDGTRLVTTGTNGLTIWDTSTWKVYQKLADDVIGNAVASVAYSPDGRLLAVSNNELVDLFETKTLTKLAVLESRIMTSNKYRLKFSQDGKTLAAQGADNSLRIWDLSYIHAKLSELHIGWEEQDLAIHASP